MTDDDSHSLDAARVAAARDDLGAWVAEVFFDRLGVRQPEALARRLVGDALSIHEDEATRLLVTCWRLRFSDAGSAALHGSGHDLASCCYRLPRGCRR